MATLGDLRLALAGKLGFDIISTSSTTSDIQFLNNWANEGYLDVLLRTKCQVESASLTLTNGTSEYALSTLGNSIVAVVEMYNAATSTSDVMERLPLEQLLRKRRAQGTSPTRYFSQQGSLLLLYPTPGTGETLYAYVINRPGALSLSGDSMSAIPREYHKAVEYYMLWQGSEWDKRPEREIQRYQGSYEKRLAEIKKELRGLGGKRLAPIIPGARTKPLPPAIRSTDDGY